VLKPLTTFDIFLHDETGQKKDITEYINSIIRSDWSMRKWDKKDKQQIIDTLSSKVDGMYVITCLVSCLGLHNERSHGLIGSVEAAPSWHFYISRNKIAKTMKIFMKLDKIISQGVLCQL
jgi:hypothetical protein